MRKLAHCFGKNAVNQLKTLVSVAGYEPTSNSEFDRKAGSPAEQASIAERCRPISPGAQQGVSYAQTVESCKYRLRARWLVDVTDFLGLRDQT